jgi:hypothetical protein
MDFFLKNSIMISIWQNQQYFEEKADFLGKNFGKNIQKT